MSVAGSIAPAPAIMPGGGNLIPFRRGARQRFDLVGNVPFASGGSGAPQRLPQVGFLNGILLNITGTMTGGAGAPALAADAPANLIRRARCTLNTGITIADCTGFGWAQISYLLRNGFNFASSGQPQVYSVPPTVGGSTWNFWLFMPIAANDGLNFDAGLINLQTEELVAQVEIDWALETAVITGGTAPAFTVGRADVHLLFYEVPDPRVVQYPPLNLVFRTIEDQITVAGVGTDQRYPILRQGTIHQLMHTLRLNSVRDTTDVTALRLELNRSDKVYRYLLGAQLFHQRLRYGNDLPVGTFVWDWWNAYNEVSHGDARDFINSEAVAQTDSILEIASTAVLGAAGTNNENTIRRFDQILES